MNKRTVSLHCELAGGFPTWKVCCINSHAGFNCNFFASVWNLLNFSWLAISKLFRFLACAVCNNILGWLKKKSWLNNFFGKVKVSYLISSILCYRAFTFLFDWDFLSIDVFLNLNIQINTNSHFSFLFWLRFLSIDFFLNL